jgi:hypothetical protein
MDDALRSQGLSRRVAMTITQLSVKRELVAPNERPLCLHRLDRGASVIR